MFEYVLNTWIPHSYILISSQSCSYWFKADPYQITVAVFGNNYSLYYKDKTKPIHVLCCVRLCVIYQLLHTTCVRLKGKPYAGVSRSEKMIGRHLLRFMWDTVAACQPPQPEEAAMTQDRQHMPSPLLSFRHNNMIFNHPYQVWYIRHFPTTRCGIYNIWGILDLR